MVFSLVLAVKVKGEKTVDQVLAGEGMDGARCNVGHEQLFSKRPVHLYRLSFDTAASVGEAARCINNNSDPTVWAFLSR